MTAEKSIKSKLIMTVAEMQSRENWLELRKKGIGGSEIASVVGLNKYKSAFQLWLEKTGQVEQEDLSDNEYIYWGNVLEQAVADRFCELTNKKVTKRGMLQDGTYPFMLASVDRMVVGENAGLECKTTNGFAGKDWKDDELPDSYYIQCQWYMSVTGCEKWYIACLIGGNKFVWKEIKRNEEDIEALRKAAIEFWHKVENNIIPSVDGSSCCSRALEQRFKTEEGVVIDLPDAAINHIEKIKEAKELIKQITETQKAEENALKLLLGNAETGIVGENKVVLQNRAGKVIIDLDGLKKDHEDIFNSYKKIGKPYKVLTIK